MTRPNQKVVQYLEEAHASEAALVGVLQSQIAMTPRSRYRTALDRHLRETREHASRVEARLGELGHGDNPIQVGIGVAQTVLAQGLAIAKTPLDLLRGSSGEEKVLKNAKDAAATEALEIATYTAIERLARDVDDDETARLAASIRADEERMLARILDEIPKLTDAVVGGEGSYDVAKTGAADAARGAARKSTAKAKRTARRAGAARAEGTARRAGAANA
jgi:ferritin-like metal-binding protein YciE